MRLAALGLAWREKGGRAALMCPPLSNSLERRLARSGLELYHARCADGGLAAGNETIEIARRAGARWVAVDGYVFDGVFFDIVARSGVKLLVVDDNATTAPAVADVLVDGAFQADADRYRERLPVERLLLGPRFALVRPEFRMIRKKRFDAPQVKRLLLTMGGSDPADASSRLLGSLGRLRTSVEEVVLAVGGLNPRQEAHFRKCGSAQPRLTIIRDVENMAGLMSECDAAISAGGSTLQELAIAGLPALLVPIAENQQAGVRYVCSQGWFRALPPLDQLNDEALDAAVGEWLGTFPLPMAGAEAASEVIDGRGAERVCERLIAA